MFQFSRRFRVVCVVVSHVIYILLPRSPRFDIRAKQSADDIAPPESDGPGLPRMKN